MVVLVPRVLLALTGAVFLIQAICWLVVERGLSKLEGEQLELPAASLLTRRGCIVRATVCIVCVLAVALIPGANDPGPLNCATYLTGTMDALHCETRWVQASQQHATRDMIVVVAWVVAFLAAAPWHLWRYLRILIALGSRQAQGQRRGI